MNYAEQRAAAFEELLARLAADAGVLRLAADDLAAQAARHELLAVLFTADPARSPESWDVCVVLPDLLASLGGRAITAAILDPLESDRAAARFGIDKRPALVLLRRGEYVGVVEGMRDWRPFVDELRRLQDAPTQPPPVAGQYPAQRPAARSA
jgi:hydrogenase-1 operon protein HyaE